MARPVRLRRSVVFKNGEAVRVSLVVSDMDKKAFEREAGLEGRSVSSWMKRSLQGQVQRNRVARGEKA